MTTCAEPGPDGPCGGSINSVGDCQRCGTAYRPPSDAAAGSLRPAPTLSLGPVVPSGGAAGSSGRRGPSAARGRRGRAVAAAGLSDPRDALLPDPALPADKRFCRNRECGQPVGRPSEHQPNGQAEGSCPACGWPFSFRPPLAPNTEVDNGHYVVEGAIGRGGLGWVYLAIDRRVGQHVVLKGLVNPDNPAHGKVPVEELRALAQAQHPNIVAVHDAVEHPYRPPGPDDLVIPIKYIVMDYIGGRSLRQLRAERGDYLPITEVCEYTLQALDALEHLHARGLLYNDFSPDNLMRSDDGRVTLIDLGGVCRLDDPTGVSWGKVGYRDPWPHPASVRTDLYAVGRTMAWLTFPVPRFADATAGLPGPDQVSLLADHESYHLFLLRATHRDPERRFCSAAEMADQLEAVLREVRAVELDEPQPGLSDEFGPELRVVGAGLGRLARPDPVAAALALPDPQIDSSDPQARRLAAITGTGSPREVLQAVEGLPERTVETRLRAVRARVELVALGQRDPHRRRSNPAESAGLAPPASEAWTQRGEHDPLRTELAALAHEVPDDVRVRWFAGLAALVTGEVERAASEFYEVLRTVPGEAAPKLALGLCAELRDQPELAARRYRIVWRTDRSYVSAAFGLARALLALGQRAEAIAALAQVPHASRYAASALLCSLAESRPADDLGGALAPGFFALAERLRDRTGGPDLDLDEARRCRAYAMALAAALDWVRAGRPWPAGAGAVPTDLLGFPLDEHGLRDGLERSYRRLASVVPEERVYWVDRANAERNRSLW